MHGKNRKIISIFLILYLTTASLSGLFILIDQPTCSTAKANSIIVDLSGNGNYTSIQEAIDSASPGDTINVWAGMYSGNIFINKSLTLVGNGTGATILNGSWHADTVLVTADWVNITGFAIKYSGTKQLPDYDSGIQLQSVSHVGIYNNYLYNNEHGIFLNNSHYNTIKENNCSGNMNGLYLLESDRNTIFNNTFFDCAVKASLKSSKYNLIEQNTFGKTVYPNNAYVDIQLEDSEHTEITSNKLDDGMFIWGSKIGHWNSHKIDSGNTVNGLPLLFLVNQTGGSYNQKYGQIILANCTGVIVKNQRFEKTIYGINLGYSDGNVLDSNKAYNSSGLLIASYSSNNTISNSTVDKHSEAFYLHHSSYNTISSNTASNCVSALMLHQSSHNNKIINNNFFSNDIEGVHIYSSKNNRVERNNLTNNWGGVVLRNSDDNHIKENYAAFNTYGVVLRNSNLNDIINNNVSSGMVGLGLENSNSNYAEGNTGHRNSWHGASLTSSSSNEIVNNTFSSNTDHGILLESDSNNNIVERNLIKSNRDTGVRLSSAGRNTIIGNTISTNNKGLFFASSSYNRIYYNNIISNTQQVQHSGTNYWNSSWQEGNYWSDYSGVDDGSNGRTAGDGIGDTNIPHLSVDNYPFMIPSGWIYLRAPLLTGPTGIVGTCNYTISWNPVLGATKYILEEDDTSAFDSPVVVYDGQDCDVDFFYKNNGTYYYRIKAQNSTHSSDWSAVLSVHVDWLPAVPLKCHASVYPQGNALNITWDPNIEGTREYEIYYKTTDNWKYLKMVLHPDHSYNHTGLEDGVLYHYKIRSVDFIDQYSDYSAVFTGIPADSAAPKRPEGFNASAVSKSTINLTWHQNSEPDLMGYYIYMNKTGEGQAGEYSLIHTIMSSRNSYDVTGLDEQVTYYFKLKAFDEVPNNSTFSEPAFATTPDETAPGAPTGLSVQAVSSTSLKLTWLPNPEHDIIGYNVYRSKTEITGYSLINSNSINVTQFEDTGVEDNTEDFYKLTALDDFGLESDYSATASARTFLKPVPPEINNTMMQVDMLEDTIDDFSINLYYWFKDPNSDPLKFSAEGEGNIEVIINHDNGDVTLIPANNWNGLESITFFADDGIFNFSDSVGVNVMPVNDPPEVPTITEPSDNKIIKEGVALSFACYGTDPDLPYGDHLYYRWESNITGKLGDGSSLSGIILPVGRHQISLWAMDSSGAARIASINVTVEQLTIPGGGESKSGDDKKSGILVPALITIAIIIIVVIALFYFMRLRKKEEAEAGLTVQEPQPQLPQAPFQPTYPADQQQWYYPPVPQYTMAEYPVQQQQEFAEQTEYPQLTETNTEQEMIEE
jgi:parallel beta-helix repeat protein